MSLNVKNGNGPMQLCVHGYLAHYLNQSMLATHPLNMHMACGLNFMKHIINLMALSFSVFIKRLTLTQNGLSVSDYYNKLDALWKKFDGLTNLPECVCEAASRYNDHLKLIKLMQFLNGLEGSCEESYIVNGTTSKC